MGFFKSIKQPLGLIPKEIIRQKRFIEVRKAINRYYNAGLKIPIEWIIEYNELVENINKSWFLKKRSRYVDEC